MTTSLHSNRQSLNRKVAVMGYPHVGKSAIVLRFTQNVFPERYESTIEDQHSKHMTAYQREYHLRVTDTAGQQEYTVFPRSCSFDINGFVLVYAIDDRKSFEMCTSIYDKIVKTYGDTSLPIVIVGNKADLNTQRVVQHAEGIQLAKKWNAKFLEITAKESNRVSEVFEVLLREIEISRGNVLPTDRPNAPPKPQVQAAAPSSSASSKPDPKGCSIS